MSDVVVTVPKGFWEEWLEEGDLPGDEEPGMFAEYHYYLGGTPPSMRRGERVYIVAHGRLRGYAPLVRIDRFKAHSFGLVRHGGAVAVSPSTSPSVASVAGDTGGGTLPTSDRSRTGKRSGCPMRATSWPRPD